MYWCKRLVLFVFSLFLVQNLSAKDINLEILEALNLIENSKFQEAIEVYEDLYKNTGDTTFLKEAIAIAVSHNHKKLENLIHLGENGLAKDPDFMRSKIVYLLRIGKKEEAHNIIYELNKIEESYKNYFMLGVIAKEKNDKKEAFLNFKKSYELAKTEQTLMMLVSSSDDEMLNIKLLKDFKDTNSCTMPSCFVLANLYMKNKKFKDAAEIYKEIYEKTAEHKFLEDFVIAKFYEKDFNAVIDALDSYEFKDDLKLELYMGMNDYDKAFNSAQKLYEKSGDSKFLAVLAVMEYEQHQKGINGDKLKSVIDKFEKSLPNLNDPVYLNYYGYLLIDHDKNYKKGIELVKKALEKEPNSAYYLDSLAWGYYKLKECKRAKEVMGKALKIDLEFANTKEAIEHKKAIDECDIR